MGKGFKKAIKGIGKVVGGGLKFAAPFAALIPGARALDIPDRDHMLAVGDKVYKAGVIDFLNQRA